MDYMFLLVVLAVIIGYLIGKRSPHKIIEQIQKSQQKPYFDSGSPELLQDIVSSLLQGKHLFLTGSAGTGKTYMVRNIARDISRRQREVVLAATTGIGACQIREVTGLRLSAYIKGLGTLHSAAILPISEMPDTPERIERGRQRFSNTSVIIIDEISMLDRLTFERFLTRLRPGIGILAVGDLFQLPPIRTTNEGHPDLIFGSEFFADFKLIQLQTIYRQAEHDFIAFLEDLRLGDPNWTFLDDVDHNFDTDFPVLCGTNNEVSNYNNERIREINHPPIQSIACPEISRSDYTENRALAWLANNTRAETRLILKCSMRVLCIQNHGGLVNGDLGTIINMSPDRFEGTGLPLWIDVKFDRPGIGLTRMVPFKFEKKRVNPRNNQEESDFIVRQYALIPAYAITVHKSQGMTLDKANIDGNRINFASGQAYVAISRVRTKSGIILQNANNLAALVHPSVKEYYQNAPQFQRPQHYTD